VFGFIIEIPFMSQELYTGPVAKMMGGADISWIVCLAVISPLYYYVSKAMMKTAPVVAAAE
jgi:NCS1 family nucleobase:cation symporter-1